MNTIKPNYSKINCANYFRRSFVLLACIMLFSPLYAKEITPFKDKELEPIVSFDEVPIEFIVNSYFRFETDVIITESNLVYINIEDLFKNLGIYCKVENNGTYLTGFIENESKRYTIDFNTKQITVGKNTIQSINGIVEEMGAIYIESNIITEAFGLTMIFNYRSLTIKLEANFELPLVKQMRLEKMRQNISNLQNKEIIADTILKRDYHLFKAGMLDWSLASYQTENEKPNNRIDLGVGTELLYGQANVSVNYNDQYKFNNRNLYYNWRWVDNDKKYIKQAQIGKIYNQNLSFLSAPVVGASINNSPNEVRKASGYYTINEETEPNWTIELYINDVLVDYTVADASGLYVFKVPIVYGYTTLKLKFYGPLGEERIEERTMNVPFTFVPAKTVEYSISGGILEDNENSKFGHGVVNYGVNRFITIGGGLEYLSSIPDNPLIPFATVAFQPFSKLGMNFEYAHNFRMRSLLSYNFGKSAFLEIDYANYVEGQLATPFNADEERKIRVSVPFKLNKVSGFTKLNFNQFVYNAFNYNQFDAVFSGYYKNYSANISTLLNWVGDRPAYITSNASLSYRLRNGLVLRPSAEYNVSDNQLLRYRAEIEKRVAKMYFSASYERNVVFKNDNVFLSFRYDLPFARTGFSSSYSNDRLSFSENAQGSLAFGADNGVITTGINSALGKGGILCYPFLDLNQNGKMDKGEPKVLLSSVRVNGGKAIISEKDSIVRISDLNAFINYAVTFSDNDLDNISWRFPNKTYQILVDPNQYKKVFVPIYVVGEVSGIVELQSVNGNMGQGRITLQIINDKGTKVVEILSESDGYFSYLGLKPGNYSIKVDKEQLKKLNYQSSPENQTFTIKESEEGTIIDGISFVLKTTTAKPKEIIEEFPVIDDNSNEKVKEKIKEVIPQDKNVDPSFGRISDINGYFYTVQLGIYKDFQTKTQLYNLPNIFYEVLPNGTIRYVYGAFDTLKAANNAKNGTLLKAIKGANVIAYNNGEMVSLIDLVTKVLPAQPKDSLASKQRFVWSVDKNVNTNYTPAFDIKELFYTVQIGAYRNYVTAKQLQYFSPLFYEVVPNGNVRYVYGKFDRQKDAKVAKNNIVDKGIKDAYVVAYKNGEQVNAYSLKKVKITDKGNSEVYGTVQVKNQYEKDQIKNIDLILFNKGGFMVGATSTDEKGTYYFVNLVPGDYTIKIDTNQLEELNYEAVPMIQNIKIKETKEMGIVKGLDFILTKINK